MTFKEAPECLSRRLVKEARSAADAQNDRIKNCYSLTLFVTASICRPHDSAMARRTQMNGVRSGDSQKGPVKCWVASTPSYLSQVAYLLSYASGRFYVTVTVR